MWKIIWSIEGLHSRDKFCYPITVTDVTLTLIKKKKTFKFCRKLNHLVLISWNITFENISTGETKISLLILTSQHEPTICSINTQNDWIGAPGRQESPAFLVCHSILESQKIREQNWISEEEKKHIVIWWMYLMFIDIYLLAQRFLQKPILMRI